MHFGVKSLTIRLKVWKSSRWISFKQICLWYPLAFESNLFLILLQSVGKPDGLTVWTTAVFIMGEMAGSGVLALPLALVHTGEHFQTKCQRACYGNSLLITVKAKCVQNWSEHVSLFFKVGLGCYSSQSAALYQDTTESTWGIAGQCCKSDTLSIAGTSGSHTPQ